MQQSHYQNYAYDTELRSYPNKEPIPDHDLADSPVFVPVDLISKYDDATLISNEDAYREWLIANFKSLWDKFPQGMPEKEFTYFVNNTDLKRQYKKGKLFAQLDVNKDKLVTWDEFFHGMTYKKKSEVSKTTLFINDFVRNLNPVAKKKERNELDAAKEAAEPVPEESYLEAYNCRPVPLFIPIMYLIVWIFFIVYAVELNNGPEWNHVGWSNGVPYYSPLAFCPSVRQQVWRYITYMWLHDGYHHIFFNTLMSLILGIPLELVHKPWRVGPVFLLGVLFGSLSSSILDPGVTLMGASGGVYSLIGAHYSIIIMNWEELQHEWTNCRSNPFRFFLSGVMRLVYLTILVIFDFGVSAYKRYSQPHKIATSCAAHVGGMMAGLLFGIPFLRNIDKKVWEGYVAIISFVIAVCLFIFGVFWNIFYKGYPAETELACSNPSLVTGF